MQPLLYGTDLSSSREYRNSRIQSVAIGLERFWANPFRLSDPLCSATSEVDQQESG